MKKDKSQFFLEILLQLVLVEVAVAFAVRRAGIPLMCMLVAEAASLFLFFILKRRGKWFRYRRPGGVIPRMVAIATFILLYALLNLSQRSMLFLWLTLLYPLVLMCIDIIYLYRYNFVKK